MADYPRISELWHQEKNGEQEPPDVKASTNRNVWLQCPGCIHGCGRKHEWAGKASNLVQYGGNIQCPYCNSRGGKFCYCNSVAASDKLLEGYHPSNPPPESVPQRTLIKLRFICSNCEGEYVSSPRQRLFWGAGCPHCRSHFLRHPTVAEGTPHLLEEWNFLKNSDDPYKVTLASNKKVWWTCSRCENEWECPVYVRTLRKSGCLKCREKNRFSQPANRR